MLRKEQHKAKTAGEEVEKENLDRITAYAASKGLSQTDVWLVDSGASSHTTWNKELIIKFLRPQRRRWTYSGCIWNRKCPLKDAI